MKITIDLPDDVVLRADPGRAVLEALAIEGYRTGALTHHQASQLLGVSRLEFDGLLKAHNVLEQAYDVDDLEQDVETLARLETSGRLPSS